MERIGRLIQFLTKIGGGLTFILTFSVQASSVDPEAFHIPRRLEIKGTTSGYENLHRDGYIDFGLVIPALTLNKIINFDPSRLFSPITEKARINSKNKIINVPGNFTFPQQRERHATFHLKFNKPNFRIFVENPGTYNLFALHGRVSLRNLVNNVAKNSPFAVINYIEFIGGGKKQVTVVNSIEEQNIDVGEVKFTENVKILAPQLPKNREMLSFSLIKEGDKFFPIDLKRAKQKKPLVLKYPPNQKKSYALSVLVPKKLNTATAYILEYLMRFRILSNGYQLFGSEEDEGSFQQLSIALQELDEKSKVQFLPLVPPPTLVGTQLIMEPPSLPKGFLEKSTLITFSEVYRGQPNNLPLEEKIVIWKSVEPGWISSVDIPQETQALDSKKTYRWEVFFLARPKTDSSLTVGTELTEGVTHITRSFFNIE